MSSSRENFEVVIIGAGLVGSSVAMHLSHLGQKNIAVIDLDLEGKFSSSELNAGGVRGTWTHPMNIELGKVSIDYFSKHQSEVGYRDCGYLWLRSEDSWESVKKTREIQKEHGWNVELWDQKLIQNHAPFLDKLEGVAGATFSPRDGLLNPNLLKNHFREEARKNGVLFFDRTKLFSAQYFDQGVEITLKTWGEHAEPEEIKKYPLLPDSEKLQTVIWKTKKIINCAGPWSGVVAEALGYQTPAKPVRRQISIFDAKEVDLTPFGMIVDTSGVYFHPEAHFGLAGFAVPDEPEGFNFRYDGVSFFENYLWPALYERSSKFESLKHVSGWAGLYEVSPDESGIVGMVSDGEAGKSKNVFEAHSFSGRGAMQSYAAGLWLSEKIVFGEYRSYPQAENLSARRFDQGELIRESLII